MYCDFFQLKRLPFENTPDSEFFYPHPDHEEALAAMCYGVLQRRGVTLITSPPGCGKSLLVRMLDDSLGSVGRLVNLARAPRDVLVLKGMLARGFGLGTESHESPYDICEWVRSAVAGWYTGGRPLALVIDQGHHASRDVLEQICALAGIESATEKGVQIVLLGHPQLCAMLADPIFEEFRQRIYCVRHLRPFTREHTARYTQHRLGLAGAGERELITREAVELVHARSGGIPRLINQIADNAFLRAFAESKPKVERDTVEEVLADMLDWSPSPVPLAHPGIPRGSGARSDQRRGLHFTRLGPWARPETDHAAETTPAALGSLLRGDGEPLRDPSRVDSSPIDASNSSEALWSASALRARLDAITGGGRILPSAGVKARSVRDAGYSGDLRASAMPGTTLNFDASANSEGAEASRGKNSNVAQTRVLREFDRLIEAQGPLLHQLSQSTVRMKTRHAQLSERLQRLFGESASRANVTE